MREITVAATQMAGSDSVDENVARAEALIREAADKGANLVLIQELFEGLYFCQDELPEHFDRAKPADGHPTIRRFQELAAELNVVLPVSFFERANAACFNSLAMVDADGSMLGVYRKSHIPQGSGY
ncbi:MAG: acyltransferase, partial [Cytophagales bacterium]|nr:acyltransferase [Cytophagales bacterium]